MTNRQQRCEGETKRKTQDVQGQESTHSTQNVRVVEEANNAGQHQREENDRDVLETPKKERLKLPPANSKEWEKLDLDLEQILESNLKGDAVAKMKALPTLVYDACLHRFGSKNRDGGGRATTSGPSRRQREIGNIRRDLRLLRRRWRESVEEERDGLTQLRSDLRSRLQTLQRAERQRKVAGERTKARTAFFTDPFKFVGDLLGRPKSGELQCSPEEMNESIRTAHSDPLKDTPLEEISLTPAPLPEKPFDMSEISFEEVKNIIRKARASSAPGPSGVTYAVYKRCPRLQKRLWRLLRVIWRNRDLPSVWLLAEGCYVPKEENASTLDSFRQISLLSVEGKIFWSVVAKRLTSYFLNNKYVDPSVQKGGISGFSGCIEHTAAITNLIQDAKRGKKDIAIAWLDLAKAYPSIPHKLIYKALEHYHVPDQVIEMVRQHLGGLKMRFTSGKITSDWQRLEKGIMAGCTVSVILFVAAMNILLSEASKECKGPLSDNNTRHPTCRAFMDDVTVITPKETGTRWILKKLDTLATWGRLTFKASKSRSLVLLKGRVSKRTFFMQGERIPSVTEIPIKCLGKWYDESLSDTSHIQDTKRQLENWLQKIDKTSLPGKLKIWCFQHGIIPRLSWPFALYEFPMTTVERMERLVNRYLRKWLGVPPSFSRVNLYSKSFPATPPISSVVEEFKVTGVRTTLLLKHSKDHIMQGVERRSRGTKWSPVKAIEDAESRLRISDIVGTVAQGRKGLGNYKRTAWSKADDVTKRKMVEDEVRKAEEEERRVRATEQGKQCAWVSWDDTESRKPSWKETMNTPDRALSFLLRSISDTLPTPVNLAQWGLAPDAKCVLCDCDRATLRHILSSCRVALKEGRYTWRHDKVLMEIASQIDSIPKGKQDGARPQQIRFLREGEKGKPTTSPSLRTGLFQRASDWTMKADIGRRLVFPQQVAVTSMRPDIVILSEECRTVVIVELTVPWEERLEESHELKRNKYEGLLQEARQNGWETYNFPVEVGCRGFPARSMRTTFKALGMSPMKIKAACKKIGGEAERCSRWLWLRHKSCWLFQ